MTAGAQKKRVLVIHGPNLNLLGAREPHIYGTTTLADIDARLAEQGAELGLAVAGFQSNSEGAIVTRVQEARNNADAIIINPAAYTHTSVAIRDALAAFDGPVVEVHISNVYKREPFRHKSMMSDVVTGKIVGLGVIGYELALTAVFAALSGTGG